MTLVEFLRYAGTNAGISLVVGFVLSFVAEWVPSYEALAPKPKRLVMMGLCFAIPILALIGLWLLAGEAMTIDLVWMGLSAGFAAFFGTQASHTRKLSSQIAPLSPLTETIYPYGGDGVPAGALLQSDGKGGQDWVSWR